MEVTVAVILNVFIAGLATKWIGLRMELNKPGKSKWLVTIVVLLGAIIGFTIPIAVYGLLEELGVVVWNEAGRLVIKMIGFGFWSSLLGAYLGFREIKSIDSRAVSQSESVTNQPPLEGLSGVGGWLAFMIVLIALIQPIMGFFGNLNDFSRSESIYPTLLHSDQWATYKLIAWSGFWVTAIMRVASGWLLINVRKPSTIKNVIILLWVSGPVVSLIEFLMVGIGLGYKPFLSKSGEQIGEIIGGCLDAGIWSLYLLKSVRVRNTYGESAIGIHPVLDRVTSIRPRAITQSIQERLRNLNKEDRQWLFGGAVWAIGVLLYTIGFDPFNNGSWDYMDSDEYSTLLFVMFVPPIFLCVAKKVYDRFVR